MRPRFVRRKMHVWLWLVSAILNLVATTSFQGRHQLHRIVSWGTTHHVGPQILAATSSPSETRDVNVKTKTTAKKGVKKEVSSSSSTSRIKGVTKKNGKVKAAVSKTKKPKKASSKSGESKETTSKKRKKKKKAEVMHWSVDSDVATLHLDEPRNVHFVVHGNPLPLRRHRTARGFMYNPSAKSQESFRNVTWHILNTTMEETTAADPTTPLFPAETPVIMSILFRMKRPKSHFVGGKPGPGRLRDTAPPQITALTRTDVDNLTKFVLDSLNGVMYEDDRQVCSLHVTRLLDDTDQCLGSTEIHCRQFTPSDIHHSNTLSK